jgi:predicted ArsR family transcriptional regulator
MPEEPLPGERRPATEAEARALASGLRLRILRLCLDRALTNKQIAELLEAKPGTILHHVRTLVATGFLEAQEERRGTRGAREVPYLATRKSWVMDVSEQRIGGSGRAMVDAFLDELRYVDVDSSAKDFNTENPAGFARLGLRLPVKDLEEMADRIGEILNEYANRPADMEHGVPFSVFLAIYRDVTRP